jgi:hypothetical protein
VPPPVRATVVVEITRTTSLEGRANVYVAPTSTGTVVTANVKYITSVAAQGMAYKYNGFGGLLIQQLVPQQPIPSVNNTTLEAGSANWGDVTVACESLGILEAKLLSLARPEAEVSQ